MSRLFAIDRDQDFQMISIHLNELRKRNEEVDFTLYNHLGDEVNGHMIVMALSCPVIRDIIHMSSRERRIFLNDVSAEAMEQLINFMYIGEVQISLNTVNSILLGAIILRMTPIETTCLDFIRVYAIREDDEPLRMSRNRRYG